MQAAHFSLLVVTTNRLNDVARFFISLQSQTYKNFSVVFVFEDYCQHEALALIEHFHTFFSIQPIIAPRCGVSHARNLGLQHLHGDYIAFPDDDCVYRPHTLQNAVELFEKNRDTHALLAQRFDLGIQNKIKKIQSCTKMKKMNIFSVFTGSETFLQFYRREAVIIIGNFDEMLGAGTAYPYGCGEDTDYVVRALEAGILVAYAPSIHVEHPAVYFDSVSLLKKTKSYACGRMYLLRKHHLPFWFRCANVLFPLLQLPLDMCRYGKNALYYRWEMFKSRLMFF